MIICFIFIFLYRNHKSFIKLHHNQYPPSDIGLFLGNHRALHLAPFYLFWEQRTTYYNISQYITVPETLTIMPHHLELSVTVLAGKKHRKKKDDPCITKIEQVQFSSVTSKSCHLLHAFRLMIIIIFKNCIYFVHFWPNEL